MKAPFIMHAFLGICLSFLLSCSGGNNAAQSEGSSSAAAPEASAAGDAVANQSDIKDDVSQPNVVKVAIGSKDHTTLVAAVQAADLVNALSNNGPFTVFAPTNEAFNALPAGTVDGLLKPEKKDALAEVLQYHVYVGVLPTEKLMDGQVFNMVSGKNATIHVKDGKYMINDANIIASVPASNGIVHVIDKVIFPAEK